MIQHSIELKLTKYIVEGQVTNGKVAGQFELIMPQGLKAILSLYDNYFS